VTLRKSVAWTAVGLGVAVATIAFVLNVILLSPEEALRRFEAGYSKPLPPGTIPLRHDVLLRGRDGTVALVARRVTDTTWAHRADAIVYFRDVQSAEAIPALERVLRDDPDVGPRIEAMAALCAIHPPHAARWAGMLSSDQGPLGEAARGIAKNGCRHFERRNFWNAFHYRQE
jgi:hypothetical protein